MLIESSKFIRVLFLSILLIILNYFDHPIFWSGMIILLSITIFNTLESAFKDELTKTYNRKFYNKYMKSLKHNLTTISIIDIDFFKKINDKYGHTAGDVILQRVSEVIKEEIRSCDVLCRLGGEEFVVISRNTSKKEGVQTAERIRKRILNTKFVVNDEAIPVTVSIGVTGKETKNPQKLFEIADEALYKAKSLGRNRVVSA